MARLGGAEVDALLQAYLRPVGAQPPAAAAGQAQQHRLAVLLHARLHAGVQVEAYHEGLRIGRLHRVLAADVLAAFGDVDAPPMDCAKRQLPAVVAGVQPVRAVGLLAGHLDMLGPAAQPVGSQLGRTGIGDHQGGVGGGGAAGVMPLRPGAGRGTAIDDQPFAPDRQLERQGAGVGDTVQPGRGRGAAIHDQHGAPGLQAVESAIGELRGHPPGAAGLGQHLVDQGAGFLATAVEQGQSAIAMAHDPQRRAHALDGADQRLGRGRLGGLQQRADLHQVLQHRQLLRRTALAMAAVRQDLAVQLLRQHAQGAGEEARVLRQRHGGGDQPLHRGQRPCIQLLGRQGGGQHPGIGDQPGHQLLAEPIIGGGGEKIIVAEPGGDARADHIGPVGQTLQSGLGDPVGDQCAGPQARGIGAQRAQVAQPGETVHGGAQQCRTRGLGEAARAQRDAATAQHQLAAHQHAAALVIAQPRVAHRLGRGVRHPGHAQAGQAGELAAGVAQPGAGGQALHAGVLRNAVMAAA